MAFLQFRFYSESLQRNVSAAAVLPTDSQICEATDEPCKTLYLLHGRGGNCLDWVTGTRIQRWAEGKRLCVVMPSGENSYYVDRPGTSQYYGRFIGEEIVSVTRKMFRLSEKREDTFLAGLSMGGYGAVRNGLKYHETFGCLAGLSSALQPEPAASMPVSAEKGPGSRSFYEGCFGNLSEAVSGDCNPKVLAETLLRQKAEGQEVHIPKIYLACGTEDADMLRRNRDFHDFLLKKGIGCTYEEGPGGHDWEFWDTYLHRVIAWLLPEKE